jgi:threonylcarbamoyladenosine tRNA methylthiotransferase CDKAL1
MKYYIETYGCTANFGNSQQLSDALVGRGHIPSRLEEADLVIVNTCAVTARTERRIRKRLTLLSGCKLIVAGCIPAALPESLQGIICRKRLGVLDESAAGEISDLFENSRSSRKSPPKSAPGSISSATSRYHACGIVNIAEGCLGRCSYCLVKKARGELKSRSLDDVVEATKKLVQGGAVEIQLAAQDTAAYGRDIGITLPEILENLAEIPGHFMLRIGMMNPNQALPMKRQLAEALNHPKVFKFLHLPLQSGSNEVLSRMKRGYSREDFIKIAVYLRNSVEDLTIVTDIIAGFPGESAQDFQETVELLRWLQPDKVNVTRFSRRPGTEAFELYDMPDRIKKERSRALTRMWLEISEERNRRYEGRTVAALVTETGRGTTMKARTMNYTGVVVEGSPTLGSQINVKVNGSNSFFLLGEQAFG